MFGLATVIAGLLTAAPATGAEDLERAVKATYLYKLAPFVTWPEAVFPQANAPLVICVQGVDPFGPLLDRAAAGQQVAAHSIAVRRVAKLEASAGCHIAYLGGSPAQSIGDALTAVRRTPVLTVTDEVHGATAGAIHFVRSAGRVRFNIDAVQAQESGLVISSKLLALAVAVKR